jgi:hypothetical protein
MKEIPGWGREVGATALSCINYVYIPVLLVVANFEYSSIHSILSTKVSEEPMLYH